VPHHTLPPAATPFFFSTGNPDGLIAPRRSEPGASFEIESTEALLHGSSGGGADLYEADALRDANRDWLRDTDHADANCDLTLLTSQTASSVSGRFSS
jgi:hypothetical protein